MGVEDRCGCIALGHDHVPKKCERPSKAKGGICTECHYWAANRRIG